MKLGEVYRYVTECESWNLNWQLKLWKVLINKRFNEAMHSVSLQWVETEKKKQHKLIKQRSEFQT